MPELPLKPDGFAFGYIPYSERWGMDTTFRIVVAVTLVNVITSAIVDTGAPWCIFGPEEFRDLRDQYAPIATQTLALRTVSVSGALYRVPMRLEAEAGSGITVDATVFVPDVEEWTLPNFIGLDGFLSRIRFAVDPEMSRFYFGGDSSY